MARADSKEYKDQQLARILGYGPAKCKKTWWAVNAAKAGFNVVLLDTDDGSHILNQMGLSDEELARIDVIKLVNVSAGIFFTKLMAKQKFVWDETAAFVGSLVSPIAEHSHYIVDPTKLTSDTIVVLDSWTRFSTIMMENAAKELDIDIAEMAKTEQEGVYGKAGMYLSVTLNRMHTLNCHTIVLGHSYTYERRSKDRKTVLSSKLQPMSSSGPHGEKLAGHFSDVLLFKLSGINFKIDTQATSSQDCGSRHIEPGLYDWDKLQFADIAKVHDFRRPSGAPNEAFKYYAPGEPFPEREPAKKPAAPKVGAEGNAQTPIQSQPKSSPIKLSGLLQKKG